MEDQMKCDKCGCEIAEGQCKDCGCEPMACACECQPKEGGEEKQM
ncbi:MAG: hypothetical protein AAB483_04070 [Patescibacteria group bacterium]